MKKLLGILIAISLISALFVIPASARATVVDAWVEGDDVAFRASDPIEELFDGKTLSAVDAAASNFDLPGIVLLQNKAPTDENHITNATVYFEMDAAQQIDTVYITWYLYNNAIIGLPMDNIVSISTSVDGEEYTPAGEYYFDDPFGGEVDVTQTCQFEAKIRLDSAVNAKYVSFSFDFGPHGQDGWWCPMWEWVGLTELSAGMQADEVNEESKEEILPPPDIDRTKIPADAYVLDEVPFNDTIGAGECTVVLDINSVNVYNPKWCGNVQLRPTGTEGVYSVVEVVQGTGGDIAFADVQEGDIALLVHGDDTVEGSMENKAAVLALAAGDTVTFMGYDFVNGLIASNAAIYFKVPAENTDDSSAPEASLPDDTSKDESTTESEPENTSEDTTSTPADTSKNDASADTSGENTSKTDASSDDTSKAEDEQDGFPWLVVGIAAAVAVVVAVVVAVFVKKGKK